MTTTTMRRQISTDGILLLVASGSSPASGSLELAALGANKRLGAGVGDSGSSEVLDGLALLAGSLHEHRVLPGWSPDGELVEGHDLSSSLQDSLPSLLSHPEGAHRHLGDVKDPDIVGDGAHTDSNLFGVASLLHVAGQSGDGERRPVDLGHEESPQDDLVELGVRPPGQKPVQLHQKSQVDVLALGLGPTDFTVLVVADINTHDVFSCRSESSNISLV